MHVYANKVSLAHSDGQMLKRAKAEQESTKKTRKNKRRKYVPQLVCYSCRQEAGHLSEGPVVAKGAWTCVPRGCLLKRGCVGCWTGQKKRAGA